MEGFKYVVLVVPGLTEAASQCRIYATEDDDLVGRRSPLEVYREKPQHWFEIGLMNAQGRIVCLEAPAEVLQDLREIEPLYGGLVARYVLERSWREQVAYEAARAQQHKAVARER